MEAPTILFCRSEECSALELSPIHPTKGGKSLQALLPPSQSTVACFAYELEQDIAALEAEASWDDVHLWDTSVADDTCARLASVRDQSSSMGQQQLTVCQASDNDSEFNIEGEGTASEKVQANAKMVAECGRPLEHGAWKGCAKSAWCDREDRHRGLCNHKASIPGPAAASVPATQGYISCQQHSQVPDNMMDSSSVTPESSGQADKLQYAAGSDQQGYTGKLQHSMDTCSMHSECPSDQAVEEHAWREVSSAPELLWSSGASQQQQLLAIPLIYQPLVKDLEAPGIGSFLTADGFCCMQETLDVPVPVVQPVTQAVHMDSNDDSSRSCTVAEDAIGRQCSGSELACSSPSSPTCSSEAASMLCYDAVSAAQLPNMCSKQPPQVSGPLVHQETPLSANPSLSDFRMAPDIPHGLLPLREVHPVDVTAQQPSAAPAVSTGVEKPMLPRLGSSHSQLSQSGVDSSERDSGTQSGAASESPDAINSVVEISAAAKSAAAAAAQVPSMQRAARIKVKPRRADEPPRQLLEPSSPKSKKRAASRTVLQPSAGHCCTQCGAVSTPVWRAGPAGPKTLCNACGVRYMKVARRSR